MTPLLVFTVEEKVFGVDLFEVERVVWMIEMTPIPHAPPHILGMINVQGQIVPVINLRHLLGLKEKELGLNDQLVIGKKGALWVDNVQSTKSFPPDRVVSSSNLELPRDFIQFVIKDQEQLILVFNMESISNLMK